MVVAALADQSHDPRIEVAIPDSIMDGLPSEEQAGQHRVDLSEFVRLIGLKPLASTIDAGPIARPNFLVPVTGPNEQVVIPVGVSGNQHGQGLRFVKAGQVEEV